MKLHFVLFAAGLTIAAALARDISDVRTVYLLPMSGGLDQQLAVSLTALGLFQVVTDPQKADAIFTDRIGANFEQTLKDLYASQKKDDSKTVADETYTRPTMQPLTRGKGDVFLVDPKSHVVLWSMYAAPKSSQGDDMNRLAAKIAARFQKDQFQKDQQKDRKTAK
jgi:hypothetical protein